MIKGRSVNSREDGMLRLCAITEVQGLTVVTDGVDLVAHFVSSQEGSADCLFSTRM